MESKQCTKCGEVKSLSMFYKIKRRKAYSIDNACSSCRKEIAKKWYYDNRERSLNSRKEYAQKHKERESKRKSDWYYDNRERLSDSKKKNYLENKDKILKRHREYREKNMDEILKREKEFRAKRSKDPDWKARNKKYQKKYYKTKGHERSREWKAKNREKVRSHDRERRKRLTNDYVRHFLLRHIEPYYITQELIELKRAQLKLYRATKQ